MTVDQREPVEVARVGNVGHRMGNDDSAIAGAGSSPPNDATIVAAWRAGNEQVFAAVVDAWSPAMLRLARLHVASREVAQDVVQETWIAAVRGIDRFEGRSSLRTWVFKILLNIARTTGAKEHRTQPFSSTFTDENGPTVDPSRFQGPTDRHPGGWRQFPDPWPTPEHAALAGEMRTVVEACVANLPDRQRAVIELRDVHGYDADEVCDLLDLTPGNQRVLLHRARATVRRDLEHYFAEPTRPLTVMQ
jgi:RNA polymerase sigma-70 factor, ECF subfamily